MSSYFGRVASAASAYRAFCVVGVLGALLCAQVEFAVAQESEFERDKKVFKSCVVEYRSYPKAEVVNEIMLSETQYRIFMSLDLKVLDSLGEKVLQARFDTFNNEYQAIKRLEQKYKKKAEEFRSELDKQPLTVENKTRADLELKVAFHEKVHRDARMKLLLQSLGCNSDLMDAMKTLSPATVAKLKEKDIEIPKLPGRPGGSRIDRAKKKAEEKLNLTPVDPEFYQTQVGKKLEKDLGGRADYWSYDYQRDELYVKVGDEIGKIMVVPQSDGRERYIRTRTGTNFDQVKTPDEKVDQNKASGKFATGDKSQDSLFGKMPSTAPTLIDENQPGHTPGDGHDHNH